MTLVLDHIDGNAENNRRENLRLLCPNCDSHLPTYKSRNRGHGRAWRRQRYADGKSYSRLSVRAPSLTLMAYDEDLAARIRDEIGPEPGLSEKKMFGGLAFLVNGNMAVAASGQGGLMVRCDPAQTEALLAEGADPFEMRGREMTGWLRVGDTNLEGDEAMSRWVGVGLGYARSLPPK